MKCTSKSAKKHKAKKIVKKHKAKKTSKRVVHKAVKSTKNTVKKSKKGDELPGKPIVEYSRSLGSNNPAKHFVRLHIRTRQRSGTTNDHAFIVSLLQAELLYVLSKQTAKVKVEARGISWHINTRDLVGLHCEAANAKEAVTVELASLQL